MQRNITGILTFLGAFGAISATIPHSAHADELSELYLNSSNNNADSAIGPNILILLDTSGSMTKHGEDELGFTLNPALYWGAPYDPNHSYPGPCDADTAYRKSFSTDRNGDGIIDGNDITDGDFQSCGNELNFPLYAVACKAVIDDGFAVDNFGEFRPLTLGPSEDYTFNGKDLDGKWYNISSEFNGVGEIDGWTVWRECASDYGIHGPEDDTTYKWPRNTETGYGWTESPSLARGLDNRSRQLVASGNYINYFRWAQTRLAAVQAALREVIAELPPETRMGVMRFDVKVSGEGSSDGAYVIQEFVELGENTLDEDGNLVLSGNRQAVIDRIYDIAPADEGGTPLGESLFEALQVFRGSTVTFGADAEIWNIDPGVWPWDSNTTDYADVASVAASRDPLDPARYVSPIIYECQKNAVIFLSDGDPDGDKNTDTYFEDLPNAHLYGAEGCDDDGRESCLREVADYMANEDLSPLDGTQTATTYTVGFGTDISNDGVALLTEAAELGGGTYTAANDYETLKNAFQVIFREEIARNQTLSSPAVTVNAFNRLAHEDALYFTVFDPILDSVHWPGNVKKYRLARQDDGDYRIVDARGNPALVDDSSAIRYDALSFWTNPVHPDIVANSGADGDKTRLGGAAYATPYRAEFYTWYEEDGSMELSANRVSASRVSNEMLGLPETATHAERHHFLGIHLPGFDVHDKDGDGIVDEPVPIMGAAPHGVPAIVNYGDSPETASQVIYAPTNDGFLHAIDTETGVELWSFIPPELLRDLPHIYHPPENTYIRYGLDGSIIAHTETVNGTEKKWLFFGMRRGGSSIYALDVTDPRNPRLLWRIQAGDNGFEDLGQTWSEPRVARVNVNGAPTSVLIFGGGYDTATQDGELATAGYVDDNLGNALYIVKAEDGTLLWKAGSGGNLVLSEMKSSIAAPVEIKDKDEDGLHDLIYAADLGGRIFRFDIDNHAASLSLAGGMIASLGAGNGGTLADNRKFFNEPDAVLVAKDGQGYWAVNIGSGDRERPKSNMETENHLFSIKDPYVFTPPPSYAYEITIDDLYDATSNDIQSSDPDTAANAWTELLNGEGWMVSLEHTGEKALAQAQTFDYRVFFTTFDPTAPLNDGACNPVPGTARLYSLDLLTAGAVHDANNDGVIDADDRIMELPHGTIPPAVTFMFVEDPETGEIKAIGITGRSDENPDLGNSSNLRRTFWNVHSNDGKEQ